MRTFYRYDDKGDQQMILVGANSAGDNIWDLNATQPGEGGLIADYGGFCPPFCPIN